MSTSVETKRLVEKASEVLKDLSPLEQENIALKLQLDYLQNSVEELQKYATEDFDSIAILIERCDKLEAASSNVVSALEEIKGLVEALDRASAKPAPTAQEEELFRFLGIEAPKSRWVSIAKTVAAVLAMAVAVYAGYKYLNKSPEKFNGTVTL